MKKISIIIIIALTLLISACSTSNEKQVEEGQLLIYTSLYPLQFLTEAIGGDDVVVHNLIPAGGDAHTYEPTSQTMLDVAKADAFIYSGAGIEAFTSKIEESLQNESVSFIPAAQQLDLKKINSLTETDEAGHQHDHEEHQHGEGVDPHIWLDPLYTIEMAESIAENLSELKPEATDVFQDNFATLKRELLQLHEKFTTLSEKASKKEFIVSHAAYGYWELRYDLKQIPITGMSPNDEPSQQELKEIIEFATKEQINYIIFEENISAKMAEIVQTELGAKKLYLNNLETITPGQLESDENYLTLMEKNINTLQKALAP